jgi:hypothetical protein
MDNIIIILLFILILITAFLLFIEINKLLTKSVTGAYEITPSLLDKLIDYDFVTKNKRPEKESDLYSASGSLSFITKSYHPWEKALLEKFETLKLQAPSYAQILEVWKSSASIYTKIQNNIDNNCAVPTEDDKYVMRIVKEDACRVEKIHLEDLFKKIDKSKYFDNETKERYKLHFKHHLTQLKPGEISCSNRLPITLEYGKDAPKNIELNLEKCCDYTYQITVSKKLPLLTGVITNKLNKTIGFEDSDKKYQIRVRLLDINNKNQFPDDDINKLFPSECGLKSYVPDIKAASACDTSEILTLANVPNYYFYVALTDMQTGISSPLFKDDYRPGIPGLNIKDLKGCKLTISFNRNENKERGYRNWNINFNYENSKGIMPTVSKTIGW